MLKRILTSALVFAVLATLASSLLTPPATAQQPISVALGYAQMTSLASATALPTIPSGAGRVFIICETQNVRWRDDGTNPTATVGLLLPVNTPLMYSSGSLANIKIIETTASAKCNVSYYS